MLSFSKQRDVLLEGLRNPDVLVRQSESDWNWLIPTARISGVLSHLATRLVEDGQTNQLPQQVRQHLESAHLAASHNRQAMAWEIDRIGRVLESVDCPKVLLKGAAYHAAKLPFVRGRRSADVDILVPKNKLHDVESRLLEARWKPAAEESLHSTYFRKWLHEIPPLRHEDRDLEVDVHHNILPLTDRRHIDPVHLLDAARPAPLDGRFHVLAPEDLFIHSAAHLFRNGDFSHGLRDLFDMHSLLEHFGSDPAFWQTLLDRAVELNLRNPCFLALRYTTKYLATQIPDSVKTAVQAWKPLRFRLAAYDRLVDRTIMVRNLNADDSMRDFSIWFLDKFPLPRVRVALTPLFWLKRLSSFSH